MAKKTSAPVAAAVVAAALSVSPVVGAVAVIPPAPQPGGRVVDIVSAKSGKTTGQLTYFGNSSAKEYREAGKASGLKGDQLTLFVNKSLRGDKDARNLLASAKLQSLFNAGAVADTLRETKGSAVLRICKPNDPLPKVSATEVLIAKLAAAGKSKDEIAAFLTLLNVANA